MTHEEMRESILRLLTGIAPEVDPRALDPGENLRTQVDLDSIDYLNFLIAIEKSLGVRISETDSARFKTIDAIVDWLVTSQSDSQKR